MSNLALKFTGFPQVTVYSPFGTLGISIIQSPVCGQNGGPGEG